MANGFQTLLQAGYNVRGNSFDKADALFWAIKMDTSMLSDF
jgi:hypothetical protein